MPLSQPVHSSAAKGKARLPDYVRDSRLQTEFRNGVTIHSYEISDPTAGRRQEIQRVQWGRGKRIGSGGFGTVLVQKRVGKEVEGYPEVRAVKKIFLGEKGVSDREYVRELEAIAKFSRARYERCFVKSYGWYEDSKHIYIAMEYLNLGDLQQYVRNQENGVSELCVQSVMFQILEGVHFMHDNEFAHRDLKPQNILVRQHPPNPWWVKIADFGISKRMEDTLGAVSSVKYSLGFVAPEVLFPTQEEEEQGINQYMVDIWAVACISVFMFTKKSPFPDLSALVKYSRDGKQLDAQPWNISDGGRHLLLRLLVRDPKERPTAKLALQDEWIAPEKTEQTYVDEAAEDDRPISVESSDSESSLEIDPGEMSSWTTTIRTKNDKLLPSIPQVVRTENPSVSGRDKNAIPLDRTVVPRPTQQQASAAGSVSYSSHRTAEERAAYIKQQAQKRMAERVAVLMKYPKPGESSSRSPLVKRQAETTQIGDQRALPSQPAASNPDTVTKSQKPEILKAYDPWDYVEAPPYLAAKRFGDSLLSSGTASLTQPGGLNQGTDLSKYSQYKMPENRSYSPPRGTKSGLPPRQMTQVGAAKVQDQHVLPPHPSAANTGIADILPKSDHGISALKKREKLAMDIGTRIQATYSNDNPDFDGPEVVVFGIHLSVMSFGPWIFDVTSVAYGKHSLTAQIAIRMWQLLVGYTSSMKYTNEAFTKTGQKPKLSKQLVDKVKEILDAGERLWTPLLNLLCACEAYALAAGAEFEFVKAMFERDLFLETTETLMSEIRTWRASVTYLQRIPPQYAPQPMQISEKLKHIAAYCA